MIQHFFIIATFVDLQCYSHHVQLLFLLNYYLYHWTYYYYSSFIIAISIFIALSVVHSLDLQLVVHVGMSGMSCASPAMELSTHRGTYEDKAFLEFLGF